tara:strand:- start:5377 stop:5598 length:222 start_codon:yes stop_codon:yes gene_type:complete
MISKTDIKDHDFKTIEEYFNYIVLSETNGNRSQVYDLINNLSKQQKKDCLEYINENESGSDAEIVKNILIQSL